MPKQHRFNVFGRIMLAELSPDGWQLFTVGNDGKRAPAGIVIPAVVEEHELGQYLDDIYHEMATPKHPVVIAMASEFNA